MHDLIVGVAFLAMILAPCLVASAAGKTEA